MGRPPWMYSSFVTAQSCGNHLVGAGAHWVLGRVAHGLLHSELWAQKDCPKPFLLFSCSVSLYPWPHEPGARTRTFGASRSAHCRMQDSHRRATRDHSGTAPKWSRYGIGRVDAPCLAW